MIDLNVKDGIAEIVLNAPRKLNALNEADLTQLSQAYDHAAFPGVRALLLRGEGRVFCAGRDISGVDPANDDAYAYLGERLTPLMQKMAGFPAPTFAAAHGACLGAGLGLLVATDVVYVAGNAKIGSPFANLGATLDSGGHWLFTERLGAHRALDLIYTGDLMSGAEAVAAGLFSRTFPADALLKQTREIVARVALGSIGAMRVSKALVAEIRDSRIGLWTAMEEESRAQGVLSGTRDYAEGFSAFIEKRKPLFQG
ncbi:enoyl-CoA hydratase/isomerase family protein [Arthrobacter sp. zg-Y820]|uniref:enoyl-CoA hydratase/isomerase family protein n=1 Tax=unclassified Arthrobacter TaxID=235627 RepID=UPI001E560E68|nr:MULTISPECIES: enoyl-CoA hydratase/isomerase family protein [unclassified Arthrobacter]MCC9195630.1 enoyl-CoA hydratase/isomerase family protein [Arthrobacter sp. zg-Y820]MDK1278489.1 enoyl-CoA hydratase/isomerase family protein [Arthrobacter sp. zg.Y820]WIB09075.1 enoyl-CoA hydratase/isomerase family protein [Arthrobacter sp. zg-Y820]